VERNGVETEQRHHDRRGIAYALAAAVLFGASTPGAKLLLGDVSPVLMAGLLYLGSGIGLALWSLVQTAGRAHVPKARLARRDLPWLVAAVLAGGVAGPVLLMWGLAQTPASTSSLLLNLEGVLTAALAWFVFHENFDRRIALGMLAIVAGSVVLSWGGTPEVGGRWGILAVAGACGAWALDNNLTRRISAADPVQIALVKGLAAGTTTVALALVAGVAWPRTGVVVLAGGLGLLGYGLSLVLFILGLRHLGAARTGAYFSCAPFIGAALAVPLLGERPTVYFLVAAVLMAVGLWLHLTETHAHTHLHAPLEHNHWHEHDEHHQHQHAPGISTAGAHAHAHVHEPLRHAHPHYPDIHHRHAHG
jgi:drug/metabolite transporter (DMT)-like permease